MGLAVSAEVDTRRCSVINQFAPLAGTAPLAAAWVLLEDNGPWGNKAPGTARFEAAPALAALTKSIATSVLLVREPNVRVDDVRRVWVAHVESGVMVTGTVNDPTQLLNWDFSAIAAGQLPDGLVATDVPLWLVCTNSSRDACCALVGRPLVSDLVGLTASAGVQLLESSHLGGHRFAPTAMSLPSGYVFGRLTVPSATAAFTQLLEGALPTSALRGRTSLNRWQQAADIAAREATGWSDVAGVQVGDASAPIEVGRTATIGVRFADGRSCAVDLHAVSLGDHPESCGKAAVPGVGIEVIEVRTGAPS